MIKLCRLILIVGLSIGLGGEIALGQHAISWGRLADGSSPSDAERARANALARESILFLERNDLKGAESRLRDALEILPNKAVWHFNLACILTGENRLDAAMDALDRATACGFTDFNILQDDPDLKPLQALPRYKQLIARKQEICHHAADLALHDLQSRFGKDYLYDVDEDQKLIFATNIDRATLQSLKTWLTNQARSQEQQLFSHKSDEFIRVVVPSPADYRKLVRLRGIMGIYEDETRTLLAERLGQVMTHEFTHALHAADQRALGQEHAVWVREGLASMYEAGEFVGGQLIPADNYRLAFVQSAARRHALTPLAKLFRYGSRDFAFSPNLAYGEASSLLLYLYDRNLLKPFYETYQKTYRSDPTGEAALEAVTGMQTPEIQKAWTLWMEARQSPVLAPLPGGPSLGVHLGDAIDGVKVMAVLPGGAAAAAGLNPGDIIVGLGDREVRDQNSLAPLISAHKPGESITLKIRRNGKYLDLPVVLGQR